MAGAAAAAAAPGRGGVRRAALELGGRPFELLSDGRLAVLHGLGELQLAVLDPATGTLADIHLPGYRTGRTELAVSGTAIANVAGGPAAPWAVLRVFPPRRARPTPRSRSCRSSRPPGPTPPTCRTRGRCSYRAGRTDA